MRTLAGLLAITLCAAGVGACGDDGVSKEDFIAEGDDLCLDLRRDLDAVEVPEPNAGASAAVDYLDEVQPIFERGREGFADMETPEDGEDLKDGLIETFDRQLEALAEAREAAEANDAPAVTAALQQGEEAGDESEAELQRYGFEECGRPG